MGTSNTKTETKIEKPVEVEKSTGFHLIELHLPTAGFGLFTLIFALLLFCICFSCFRYFSRRWMRRPHGFNQPYVQWSPHGHRPHIVYFADPFNPQLPPMPLTSRIQEVQNEGTEMQSQSAERNGTSDGRSACQKSAWINGL